MLVYELVEMEVTSLFRRLQHSDAQAAVDTATSDFTHKAEKAGDGAHRAPRLQTSR